jgi:hypothetical protein
MFTFLLTYKQPGFKNNLKDANEPAIHFSAMIPSTIRPTTAKFHPLIFSLQVLLLLCSSSLLFGGGITRVQAQIVKNGADAAAIPPIPDFDYKPKKVTNLPVPPQPIPS